MAQDAGSAESTRVWHVLPLETVFGHLEFMPSGLRGAEASRRLASHGPNELQGAPRVSPWALTRLLQVATLASDAHLVRSESAGRGRATRPSWHSF